MDVLLIPISPGELLDKITILRIKAARMQDADKLANIRRELALLDQTRQRSMPADAQLSADEAELEKVNAQLWDIEDRIRKLESQQRFDASFIELARSVYMRNDERAAIKQRINRKLNSTIVEEKSYQPYRKPQEPV
jgi:septal ring factor EnvC (AmiA/AmiB activator)